MFTQIKSLIGHIPDPATFLKFVTDLKVWLTDPAMLAAKNELAAIMADPNKAAVVADLMAAFAPVVPVVPVPPLPPAA